MVDNLNVFEVGQRLSQALDEGVGAFDTLAKSLGYTPFQGHDFVRVYRAFSQIANQINIDLQTLSQQAIGINLPKLALIAPVIEKAPHTCKDWLDLAQDLPLQDLLGPVRQALQELQHD